DLRRDPELEGELARRAPVEGREERLACQAEVALVVARVDAADDEIDLRAEADVGKSERGGVAAFEPLGDVEFLVVFAHLVVEDEKLRQIGELEAHGERDGLSAYVAMTVFEAYAKAVAGIEAPARLDVLRG